MLDKLATKALPNAKRKSNIKFYNILIEFMDKKGAEKWRHLQPE
jgi:hypothetical protein